MVVIVVVIVIMVVPVVVVMLVVVMMVKWRPKQRNPNEESLQRHHNKETLIWRRNMTKDMFTQKV